MEYFVEDILEHRGKHQRTHIEFIVKWLNYPSDKNTWEPYSSLRDVDKLHDYLRQHNCESDCGVKRATWWLRKRKGKSGWWKWSRKTCLLTTIK